MNSTLRIVRLPRFAGAAILCLALVAGHAGTASAQTDGATGAEMSEAEPMFGTQEEAKPLAVGAYVPVDAKLKGVDGAEVTLGAQLAAKPAVIVFYRGGWCPYCNTHLADLAKIQPELAERGVQIIAITPDSPAELAKTMEKAQLPYALLSDGDFSTMKSFGVGFMLDEGTRTKYEGFGVKASVLPVPSVFVVDSTGAVQFVHSNTDYKARLSGAEVLAAVNKTMAEPAADASGAKKKSAAQTVTKLEPEAMTKPTSRPTKKR